MSPSPPSSEALWVEQIRRKELTRCALTLNNLARNIQLTEDYVTIAPKILAKLISGIAKIIAEKVPSEVPTSELGDVNTFLGQITSHLRYAERAKVAQTPWSVVQPTEKLLVLATDPKSQFIIRPTWTYNYSLIGEFWESYRSYLSECDWFPIDKLRTLVPDISDDPKIYCLSFPRIERTNCLLHANWGHEVGHILAKRWIDTEFNDEWKKAEPAIKKNIFRFIKNQPTPFEPLFKDQAVNLLVAQDMKSTLKAAQQGLIELLCDRIGAHIFGPSSLAASLEFSTRFALDISPLEAGYYPPWRYRIRKIVEYCEQDLIEHKSKGYPDETLTPFIDWLRVGKRLADHSSDLSVLKASIVTKHAYEFIDSLWSKASNAIIRMLPQDLLKPYRLNERYVLITDLVARIQNGIPPNESMKNQGEQVSLQDILCSAWAYKIRQIDIDSTWGSEDDYSLLFRLVLKACESSYVCSKWGPDIKKMDSL